MGGLSYLFNINCFRYIESLVYLILYYTFSFYYLSSFNSFGADFVIRSFISSNFIKFSFNFSNSLLFSFSNFAFNVFNEFVNYLLNIQVLFLYYFPSESVSFID